MPTNRFHINNTPERPTGEYPDMNEQLKLSLQSSVEDNMRRRVDEIWGQIGESIEQKFFLSHF